MNRSPWRPDRTNRETGHAPGANPAYRTAARGILAVTAALLAAGLIERPASGGERAQSGSATLKPAVVLAFWPGGPKDDDEDLWALRIVAASGADHQAVAEAHAKTLRELRGLKSKLVQVVHASAESVVYYGRCKRVFDAKTGGSKFDPDLTAELKVIREHKQAATGRNPYALAVMDTLPPPPSKYAAWDLAAQKEGYWTLQVGAFYNTEGMKRRRQAAEEYCKMLRDQGEKAFFHHGATVSSVCLGLFPESAIKVHDIPDPKTHKPMTVSEIVDPALIALQKKFPNNTENGHIIYQVTRDPATGEVKSKVAPDSFVVKTPNAANWKPALKPKDKSDGSPRDLRDFKPKKP